VFHVERRNFLRTLVGGVAVAAAARTWPFRVYSFPSNLGLVHENRLFWWGQEHIQQVMLSGPIEPMVWILSQEQMEAFQNLKSPVEWQAKNRQSRIDRKCADAANLIQDILRKDSRSLYPSEV